MRQSFLLPGKPPFTACLMGFALMVLLTSLTLRPALAEDEKMLTLSIANEPNQSTGKTVQARLFIDAPPNLVWQTITNYAEIKHILPGYDRSTVLKSTGASKVVDLGMKVSAFLPTYHYQVQTREDQSSYNLNLHRISGDFKSLNAHYKLVPQNNGARTLLIYNLELDTGINLPGSQAIIRANTEKSMKALERHIVQEARKNVIGQR